ncbi:hypothetical protein N2152v2_000730 [Parachlorella kessleri]
MPAEYQQTLRKSFTLGGIGLHTGEYAYVRVKPACPGEGRYFVKVPDGTNADLFQLMRPDRVQSNDPGHFPTDDLSEDVRTGLFFEWLKAQEERGFEGDFDDYLEELKALDAGGEAEEDGRQQAAEEQALPRAEGAGEFLPASIDLVAEDHRLTTVLGQGESRVVGAEALLAALEACGVDNARIELEGGSEVPIVDGSALGWCIELQKAGVRPALEAAGGSAAGQQANRTAPSPMQPIVVQEGESFVAFYPGPTARLSVGLDYSAVAPVIGRQWFSWSPEPLAGSPEQPAAEPESFRWEVAPARTCFPSAQEVMKLVSEGEIKGGPDFCALVADFYDWHDDSLLRFPADEAARHALLDILGNLSLLARPGHRGLPVGHIVAFNASPALQLRFVRELKRHTVSPEFCDHVPVSC